MDRPANDTDLEAMNEFAARSELALKHLAAWQALIPAEERDNWWTELRKIAESHARKCQN